MKNLKKFEEYSDKDLLIGNKDKNTKFGVDIKFK